jgi:tetraacyldisaccharide 4'-kinase
MNPGAVLFVTNGHGEASIAARIARDVRALAPLATDHFALVGERFAADGFPDVGPQRAMPSGGLVAMGNVRAFGRDVGAGWLGLFAAQWRFLQSVRRRYAAVVAVGDAYAAALARRTALPLIFVGTAKSAYVAPYGALERRIIRAARRVFVRDAATAAALRQAGVAAEAPGNVIVDLLAGGPAYDWPGAVRIALLPGSRERAYADAARIVDVVERVAARVPGVAAALSIAPTLAAERFAPLLERSPAVAGWTGDIGGILRGAHLAIGQAGTANEAAAAQGVPVVALELAGDRRSGWYRMRQEKLLGAALLVLPGEPASAAEAVVALLADPPRLARMAAAGRERMGGAGGAAAIARAIVEVAVPGGAAA